MEYEWSQIEWWLVDPDGNNASHSFWDTSTATSKDSVYIDPWPPEDHPELKMRHNMKLIVTDSRDVHKSRLKLVYVDPVGAPHKECNQPLCTPYYETETDDEHLQSVFSDCSRFCEVDGKNTGMLDNTDFSCDPVAGKYQKWNGGYQRHFKCWWPQDYHYPFWLVPDPCDPLWEKCS